MAVSDSSTNIHAKTKRYARGELVGDELNQFEDYLMEHPDLLEEIEAELVVARAFRAQSLEVTEPADVIPHPSLQGVPKTAYLATAASLMLAVGFGFMSFNGSSESRGLAIDAEVRLEGFRSGGGEKVATVPPAAEHTLVVVDVGPNAPQLHHIVVTRGDGSEFIRINNLKAIDGYLQFTAPRMDADFYAVDVYAPSEVEPTMRYAFEVDGG